MNGRQGCAYLNNKNPEYSWQVNLRTLHNIEQFIVHGKLLGMYTNSMKLDVGLNYN